MKINDEIKIEKFEDFYKWLKEDGLVAKRSERLLKKRIFRNLLGGEEMTIENFEDFLEDEEEKMKRKERNYAKNTLILKIKCCLNLDLMNIRFMMMLKICKNILKRI